MAATRMAARAPMISAASARVTSRAPTHVPAMHLCVPSGSATYNKLYPEKSSDGVLRLGNIAPDFSADVRDPTYVLPLTGVPT
eukprot:4155042-Pleurochrysis_carterae.AAC.2